MPTFKVRDAGVMRNATAVRVKKAGAMVAATFVRRRQSGAWVDVWPLTLAVNIADRTISKVGGTSGLSWAGVRYANDGQSYERKGSTYTVYETWKTTGAVGDYEIRCTKQSGVLGISGDAVGTWLSLATTRTWSGIDGDDLDATPETAVLLIEIRYAGGAVIDTATITLSSNWMSA